MRHVAQTIAAVTLCAAWVCAGTCVAVAYTSSRPGLPIDYLQAPSPSMGRGIKVEFQGGGPKAVYLLDGQRAREDWNGWDIEAAAFTWYNQSGLYLVMPVGGQSSNYTDWYRPAKGKEGVRKYKWETFLTNELPDWLANNRGISRTRNAVVGLSMAAVSAVTLSIYHPPQFTYVGALSSPLHPSAAKWQIAVSMADAGGFNSEDMWVPDSDPVLVRNDPFLSIDKIIANNTRLWIYCGNSQSTDLDRERNGFENPSGAVIEQQVIDADKKFADAYAAAGGANAPIDFPSGDIDNWTHWGQQLQAMKSDVISCLEAH